MPAGARPRQRIVRSTWPVPRRKSIEVEVSANGTWGQTDGNVPTRAFRSKAAKGTNPMSAAASNMLRPGSRCSFSAGSGTPRNVRRRRCMTCPEPRRHGQAGLKWFQETFATPRNTAGTTRCLSDFFPFSLHTSRPGIGQRRSGMVRQHGRCGQLHGTAKRCRGKNLKRGGSFPPAVDSAIGRISQRANRKRPGPFGFIRACPSGQEGG